ncbi:PaaI family thioesterase [Paracoccus subflavus]|uniref:PaaI family thioesterase n=1 Tax=Paracoccus subflavus TaxID=2528244 RepID=A0A4V2JBW5_9RHOB|nr:PaaI family thioesterase [Paracoccus subflavus]TBN37993.1 PaaI family thioesterase [Paracoccus subflavus]
MEILMDADRLNAFLATDFPQVADGCSIRSVAPDKLVALLQIGDQHLRPGGTVSGPSIFALADVAIYCAILSRIGPVALAVTINASIDFMRKPAAGRNLLAECRILKLGRSLAVAEAMIFSEGSAEGVARCSMTYSIPPKRQ